MSTVTTAATLDEALAALHAGARPVAGGTDLVVAARSGKAPLPEALVAIQRVPELKLIEASADGLRIGALVTHAELTSSPVVRSRLTALADACAIVGSHATRAHGTIGGNLMNASPAMETGGPLVCFGASVLLRSAAGERTVPVEELWRGPGQTVASPEELLVHIDVPYPQEPGGSAYQRLEYRRHMEIAVVGVTAAVSLDGATIRSAHLAVTAAAPTIRRVADAEALLEGGAGDDASVARVAETLARAAQPISDVRGSADYRRAMVAVIGERVISQALARAREKDA